MWLLDESLPVSLRNCLNVLGVETETVEFRQWKGLRNGKLVEKAAEAGFNAILTRDRLFAQDAKRALGAHRQVAIVLILLPQLPRVHYIKLFETQWRKNPILPVAQQMIEWPIT